MKKYRRDLFPVGIFRLFCLIVGIDASPVDHEFLIQKLGDEVNQHGARLDDIIVYQGLGGSGGPGKGVFSRQRGGPPGAQGREDHVEQRHQQHGFFQIRIGAEGVLPVEGKVPQHGQNQAHQVSQPGSPVKHLVKQGIGADLDDAGADGEEGEFQGLQGFMPAGGLLFVFAHGVSRPFGILRNKTAGIHHITNQRAGLWVSLCSDIRA